MTPEMASIRYSAPPIIDVSTWPSDHPVLWVLVKAWEAVALGGLFLAIPAMVVLLLPWLRQSWARRIAHTYPWLVFIGTWLTWTCWLFIPAHVLWGTLFFGSGTVCCPPHREAFCLATAMAFFPAAAHVRWALKDETLGRSRNIFSLLFVALPIFPALLTFGIAMSAVAMDVFDISLGSPASLDQAMVDRKEISSQAPHWQKIHAHSK